MTIHYFLNRFDTAKPVYEVNFATNTWRVVAFTRTQYGDEFISGRIHKPLISFVGHRWKRVNKPGPEYGRRLLA
jgi:hypothetical protein